MKLKNGGMLLLTAFIWGTAFVAQSVGMDYLGPFSFNGIRCLIGAVALLPCIWFLNRMNKDTETDCSEKEKSGKELITGGIASEYYYLQRAVSNRLGFSIPQREKQDLLLLFIS